MDLLQQSAQAWKEITEYRYLFTYGYKNQLYPINLTFSLEDYPHLAGFQTKPKDKATETSDNAEAKSDDSQ